MQPVVYVVSRFPKVTETFVIDEIVELRRSGVPVSVLSLLATHEDVVQPAAAELVAEASFGSRSPSRLVAAQAHWLRRRPLLLLRLWWRVLTQNRSSVGEWLKSIVTLLTAVAWAQDLEQRPPGRLHAHWATHPTLAAYVMSHLLDVPYGFTSHAHDLYNENGMLAEKLRAAELAVTISDYNVELLRRRFGGLADKVELVHCGVDRESFRPTAVRAGRLDPLHVLCVASLSEYKGHRHLLEALATLVRSGQAVRCTLVGDGPLRGDLERQRDDLGLTSSVELLGRRTSPEVRALLQECDVFVLPSVRTADGMMEGIPVALMEALASGRPAVASRLSGIPELVEDGVTGLLVPPEDPAALAAALARLAADEQLRRALADAGPRRIADGFDQRANVAHLRRLFSGEAA